MKYEIRYHPSIKKDLKKIGKSTVENFFYVMNSKLKENPYSGKKLKGKYIDLWRSKIGSYRIIYQIYNKKLIVLVLSFRLRQNIYDSGLF